MKRLIYLIALILAVGVVFSACKPDPPKAKTDEELQLEKLAKTWVVESGSNNVTIAENDATEEWAAFELTFAGGDSGYTYTSSGAFSTEVWPTSGSWNFTDGDVTIVERSDGTDININVSDNSLLMTFNYVVPGGRLDGIEGNWVFNMVPK